MKIVFFGTSNLALPILEALRTQHEIVAVVTTPDAMVGRKQEVQESPVSALAKDLNFLTFKPESLKNNQELFNQLSNLAPDIFVVVAYGKFLPNEFLNLPKYKAVNFHPSALPKYRGPSPIRTALLNGDEYTGATFILLDDLADHGPVLSQEIVKIDPSDNNFTLEDKLAKAGKAMVNQVIDDYTSGKVTPLPQDDTQAVVTKMITKDDGKINWNKSATQIYNQFRAFYMWPGIWTTWNGKKIKITDCITDPDIRIESGSADNCGYVLPQGAVVCANSTILKINSLQPEGKSEMDIADFLNGYKDFTGSTLGIDKIEQNLEN